MMFDVRSYMLDAASGRVPTVRTLREIVDILARCRYNQFQLNIGHAFAYGAHPGVWEDIDAFTPDEIRKLDAYCGMQGVELVAGLEVFSGMERWLTRSEYNHLAKYPKGGVITPDGEIVRHPGALDASDPAAFELVAGLLDELLPNFSSSFVNIGFAESPEVSDPSEYAGFLRKVSEVLRRNGKRPVVWADAVLKKPSLAGELPDDAVIVARGYEGDHPFERDCAALRSTGKEFYVSPGTSAWRSLAGRVENMRENTLAAERAGRINGAKGYLLADWGLDGHWQPLAASLPGIIMGGAFAASGAKAAKMDLELELNRVMDVPLGGTLLRLGTLYLCGGAARPGRSELFNILSNGHGYSRHPALTDSVLSEISGVAHGCRIVAERWAERSDWAKEIVYMANLIDCACHRRDEGRLRELRDEHSRVWRLRSRDAGRMESLARLPRF